MMNLRSQFKFVIFYKKGEKEHKELVNSLISVNEKEFGEVVTIKMLLDYSLRRLTKKDVQEIKNSSLSVHERIEQERQKFNQKNNLELTLEEFLIQKLKIN